jgi:hypothetical protein
MNAQEIARKELERRKDVGQLEPPRKRGENHLKFSVSLFLVINHDCDIPVSIANPAPHAAAAAGARQANCTLCCGSRRYL